jgi:hypothetical protein
MTLRPSSSGDRLSTRLRGKNTVQLRFSIFEREINVLTLRTQVCNLAGDPTWPTCFSQQAFDLQSQLVHRKDTARSTSGRVREIPLGLYVPGHVRISCLATVQSRCSALDRVGVDVRSAPGKDRFLATSKRCG